MPFWFTLVMMVLFSALPAAAIWSLVQKWTLAMRVAASLIAGMAPLTFLGWMVYRSRIGNGDLSPLHFFYLMLGVSCVCALLAVFAMEWRMRRKKLNQ
jgi:hypothetical protein